MILSTLAEFWKQLIGLVLRRLMNESHFYRVPAKPEYVRSPMGD
jgi:hypothetical protein